MVHGPNPRRQAPSSCGPGEKGRESQPGGPLCGSRPYIAGFWLSNWLCSAELALVQLAGVWGKERLRSFSRCPEEAQAQLNAPTTVAVARVLEINKNPVITSASEIRNHRFRNPPSCCPVGRTLLYNSLRLPLSLDSCLYEYQRCFFLLLVSDLFAGLASVQHHGFRSSPSNKGRSIENDCTFEAINWSRRTCISRSCSIIVFFFFCSMGKQDLELVVGVNRGTLSRLLQGERQTVIEINRNEVITYQIICRFVSCCKL